MAKLTKAQTTELRTMLHKFSDAYTMIGAGDPVLAREIIDNTTDDLASFLNNNGRG